MLPRTRTLVFLALNSFACIGSTLHAQACKPEKEARQARFRNPAGFPREGEIVRIRREALKSSGACFPILRTAAGEQLPIQFIDSSPDGQWATLLVSVNLAPHEIKTVKIDWFTREHLSNLPIVADVRLSLRSTNGVPTPNILHDTRARGFIQDIAKPKYQMEGPGIENDKFALRVFFDHRNGKDLYGKRVSSPVLEQVGVGKPWHTLQDWGMDILKTGDSIGAGGLAVQEGGKLYRLADADRTAFTSLYSGPLKGAFQLDFKAWDVGKAHADGSELITLEKGDFFFRDRVTAPLQPGQLLVTGLPSFYPSAHSRVQVLNSEYSSLSTWGPQAEGTNTMLGLAIIFPSRDRAASSHTNANDPSIPSSHLVFLKPRKTTDLIDVVCWELTDHRFATEAGFSQDLKQVADRLTHPIRVQIDGRSSTSYPTP